MPDSAWPITHEQRSRVSWYQFTWTYSRLSGQVARIKLPRNGDVGDLPKTAGFPDRDLWTVLSIQISVGPLGVKADASVGV